MRTLYTLLKHSNPCHFIENNYYILGAKALFDVKTFLQDTNEKLFYDLLGSDIEKYLPLVYTPTVGLVCQRFGLVYRRPRGLFISIHDKGNIYKMLRNW